jgi:hypothetical protein
MGPALICLKISTRTAIEWYLCQPARLSFLLSIYLPHTYLQNRIPYDQIWFQFEKNAALRLEILNSNIVQCTLFFYCIFERVFMRKGKNMEKIKATKLCRHRPAFRTGHRTRARRLRWGTSPSPSTSAQRAPATPPPLSSSPMVPPGTSFMPRTDLSLVLVCIFLFKTHHIY